LPQDAPTVAAFGDSRQYLSIEEAALGCAIARFLNQAGQARIEGLPKMGVIKRKSGDESINPLARSRDLIRLLYLTYKSSTLYSL
jgi:hypothetical protein